MLEMNSAETNLRVLVDNRLAVGQQCAFLARKTNGMP